jgi:hypothetical protein
VNDLLAGLHAHPRSKPGQALLIEVRGHCQIEIRGEEFVLDLLIDRFLHGLGQHGSTRFGGRHVPRPNVGIATGAATGDFISQFA